MSMAMVYNATRDPFCIPNSVVLLNVGNTKPQFDRVFACYDANSSFHLILISETFARRIALTGQMVNLNLNGINPKSAVDVIGCMHCFGPPLC